MTPTSHPPFIMSVLIFFALFNISIATLDSTSDVKHGSLDTTKFSSRKIEDVEEDPKVKVLKWSEPELPEIVKKESKTEGSSNSHHEPVQDQPVLTPHGISDILDLVKDLGKAVDNVERNNKNQLSELTDKYEEEGDVDDFKLGLKARYPGSKWCGDDASVDVDDGKYGVFSKSDNCCREQRLCPDIMRPNATKHGLTNTDFYTRLNCECDREFYNCLKYAGDELSERIGFTYFNVLGPQCFEKEFPIVRCLKWRRGRCVEYKLDSERRSRYQWFDNPIF